MTRKWEIVGNDRKLEDKLRIPIIPLRNSQKRVSRGKGGEEEVKEILKRTFRNSRTCISKVKGHNE